MLVLTNTCSSMIIHLLVSLYKVKRQKTYSKSKMMKLMRTKTLSFILLTKMITQIKEKPMTITFKVKKRIKVTKYCPKNRYK